MPSRLATRLTIQGARLFLLLGAAAAGVAPASAQQASFRSLGQMAGSQFGTYVSGVSADGRVVVGNAYGLTFDPFYGVIQTSAAFRWTEGGFTVLPGGAQPGAIGTVAVAISGDGRVVIGADVLNNGYRAGMRWVGTERFDTAPYSGSGVTPRVVSFDGSIIVANDYRFANGSWSFLTAPRGGQFGACGAAFFKPEGITLDGTLAGCMAFGAGQRGLLLSDGSAVFPPMQLGGECRVSSDGSTLCGDQYLWRRGSPVRYIDLPILRGISGDGGVVVGTSGPDEPPFATSNLGRAVVWTEGKGRRRLACVLEQLGVDVSGWTLVSAAAVSADGRTIVGSGINPQGAPEGWIAHIEAMPGTPDFNQDRVVDPDDISDFIGCFFGTPACADADFNGDGVVDPDDLSDMIGAYFLGCV